MRKQLLLAATLGVLTIMPAPVSAQGHGPVYPNVESSFGIRIIVRDGPKVVHRHHHAKRHLRPQPWPGHFRHHTPSSRWFDHGVISGISIGAIATTSRGFAHRVCTSGTITPTAGCMRPGTTAAPHSATTFDTTASNGGAPAPMATAIATEREPWRTEARPGTLAGRARFP
jgi:hypothetical protein